MAQNKWGISEKQLEDWFVQQKHPFGVPTEALGRQIQLQHGRLDVLAYGIATYIIELKARELKERDVGQVLRYRFDVMCELLDIAIAKCPISIEDKLTVNKDQARFLRKYARMHGYADDMATIDPFHIKAVLIGVEANDTVLTAAFGASIMVYTWSLDQATDRITLSRHLPSKLRDLTGHSALFPEWAERINSRIVDHCLEPEPNWMTDADNDLIFGN